MKDLKLSTFANFRDEKARKSFNRAVRKLVPVYMKVCSEKEIAVNCAVWVALRDNPALWTMGPCIEHRNLKNLSWVSPETLTAAFTGVLA